MASFRFDKLTVKAQEAVQTAQGLADREGHQQIEPEHLLLALVEQEDGVVGALLAKLGARAEAIRRDVQGELRRLPEGQRHVRPVHGPPAQGRLRRRVGRDGAAQGRLLLDRAPPRRDRPGGRGGGRPDPPAGRRHEGRALPGARRRPGLPARHRPEPRGEVPGARALQPRPDGARAQGQARPGDRPRRGDPPGRPGAVAADEEQPGADRGAGRRQDRHRRGARPAHRRRRRARGPQGQAPRRPRSGRPHRRDQVPRRVRGPAEGGAPRDHRGGRRDHLLHRRAPHPRRRGRRRGRDGRLEHAEAGARPRRAPLHRRDHARRVPEARREGRGARAALPAHLRQGALRRGHDRDPPRAQGEVRGPPQGPDQGLGAGRGGRPLPSVHRRPLPPRQGDRPRSTRRPRGSGSRSTRCRPSSTRSSAGSCSSRSSASRSRRRPTSRRASASSGWTASWPTCKERSTAFKARWQGEKDAIGRIGKIAEEIDAARTAMADAERRGRPRPGGGAPLRQAPPAPAAARGRERAPRRGARAGRGSSRRRSTRRTSPRWWPSGPGSRSRDSSRARSRSSSRWRSASPGA